MILNLWRDSAIRSTICGQVSFLPELVLRMKADLHVHSTYSDGSDSIEMVMREEQLNGVTHLSFVDHDKKAGLLEAQRLGEHYGIEVIPGIEISAYDVKRDLKVHILGYN